ncbi:MAG: PDR/VanB family oxidoreductase [Pseudomonadota bacterium]
MQLTLEAVHDVTDKIRVFRFTGEDLPTWDAGAHVDFMLPAGTRSYSLIDWTGSPLAYEIAVKREDDGSGGSQAMHGLSVGNVVEAGPPKNDFPLSEGPALLIAGGIGITPLISMAARLQADGREYALHYAAQSPSEMAFRERLAAMCGQALVCHFDDEQQINLDSVITTGCQVYICGPKGMIDAAREIALAKGIPREHIHHELFTSGTMPGHDGSFEVVLHRIGESYMIPPDRSIIEVLEAAGHDLVYDCQRGDCGVCQVDVIAGTPDHRDVVLSKAEQDSGKVILTCVSRSLSPRLVLNL